MVVFTISMHALNTYIGLSLMPLTSKTGLLCITGIKLLCIRLDRAPQQEACQKNHLQHYNCLPPMQIRLSYTVFVWLPNSTFIFMVLYIGQNIKINAEYQGTLLLWHASSMSLCAIWQIRSVQRSIYQTFTQLVCQSQVWFPNDPIFQKSVYYFKTLHWVTWYERQMFWKLHQQIMCEVIAGCVIRFQIMLRLYQMFQQFRPSIQGMPLQISLWWAGTRPLSN